jgi:hypothetical protein
MIFFQLLKPEKKSVIGPMFFFFFNCLNWEILVYKIGETEIVVSSDKLIKWKMVDFKSNFSYAYNMLSIYFFVSPLK